MQMQPRLFGSFIPVFPLLLTAEETNRYRTGAECMSQGAGIITLGEIISSRKFAIPACVRRGKLI